jgi:anti-sigma B factor antagonist
MSEKDGVKIETKVLDEKKRILLISVDGYIDQANSHLLQKVIDDSIADHYYRLIFNLQKLGYMSSAGWGVLIGEIKRFRENGGDIKIAGMGPEIYEIYQMLEFYHIISEYASIEEAINSFNGNQITVAEKLPEKKSVKPRYEAKPTVRNREMMEEPDKDSSEFASPQETPQEELVTEEELDIDIEGLLSNEGIAQPGLSENQQGYIEFDTSKFHREVEIKHRPISDKIRHIVANNPDYGFFKIKKQLNTEEYGFVKVGFWKLRSLLKLLDLDTKEKRYRFFRSA